MQVGNKSGQRARESNPMALRIPKRTHGENSDMRDEVWSALSERQDGLGACVVVEEEIPEKESLTDRLPRAAGDCTDFEVAPRTIFEERKNVIPDFGRKLRGSRCDVANIPV